MASLVKVVDRNYLLKQFQSYDTNVVAPQINRLDETKVDKVPGYRLTKNDFTDALKEKLEGLSNYDDSTLSNRVGAVESTVETVESAINTLNGDAATEGSVAKMTADAVASIVNSAPQDFDTLKEISDWIGSHADSAASMNSQIADNASRIEQLESQISDVDITVETHDIDFTDLYGDGNPDLTLSATKTTLYVGETTTITSDEPLDRMAASDPNKVSVAPNSETSVTITALEAGTVTVTGIKEGYTSGEVELTILPAKVEIVGEAEVYVGETLSLNSNADNTVWSSSNDEIATVDENGVVTGVAEGEVTITASAEGYSNGTKGITVSVKPQIPQPQPEEPDEPVNTEITIFGDESVNVGDSITLSADVDGVEWSSSNDEIATVDENGVVTGVAEGEVTITASAEGYSNGTKTIGVTTPPESKPDPVPENPDDPENQDQTGGE